MKKINKTLVAIIFSCFIPVVFANEEEERYELIIKKGEEEILIPKGDMGGGTYLHQLILERNIEKIKEILEKEKDFPRKEREIFRPIFLDDKDSMIYTRWNSATCLHLAAYLEYEDIVQLLLQYKIPEFKMPMNNGWTPLLTALESKNKNIIQLFLDSHTPEFYKPWKKGINALTLATEKGLVDIVQIIVDAKIPELYRPMEDGKTPLIIAAHKGHAKIVPILLESEIPEFLAPLPSGRNALYFAAGFGHKEIVRYLLDSKKPDLYKPAMDGTTALISAICEKRTQIVKMIVESGIPELLIPKKGIRFLQTCVVTDSLGPILFLLHTNIDVDKPRVASSIPEYYPYIITLLVKMGKKRSIPKNILGYIFFHFEKEEIPQNIALKVAKEHQDTEILDLLERWKTPDWSPENHPSFPKELKEIVPTLLLIFKKSVPSLNKDEQYDIIHLLFQVITPNYLENRAAWNPYSPLNVTLRKRRQDHAAKLLQLKENHQKALEEMNTEVKSIEAGVSQIKSAIRQIYVQVALEKK